MSRLAAASTNLSRALPSLSIPHLSIGGNTFTLIDGPNKKVISKMYEGMLYCRVLIVDMNPNVSRIYYKKKYDPKEEDSIPPTCFSDDNVAPALGAQEKQSDTCAGCPHNVWGSQISETGNKVKACREYVKIAIIVPDFDMNKVFMFRVPPASLRTFQKYVKSFDDVNIGGRRANLGDFATMIYFIQGENGKIDFQPMDLEDGEEGTAERVYETKAAEEVLGLANIQYDNALPAPTKHKAIAAPKAAVAEEDEEDEVVFDKKMMPVKETKATSKLDDEDEEDEEDYKKPVPKPSPLAVVAAKAKQEIKDNKKPGTPSGFKKPDMTGLRTKQTMSAKADAVEAETYDSPVAGIPSTSLPPKLAGMLGDIMGKKLK